MKYVNGCRGCCHIFSAVNTAVYLLLLSGSFTAVHGRIHHHNEVLQGEDTPFSGDEYPPRFEFEDAAANSMVTTTGERELATGCRDAFARAYSTAHILESFSEAGDACATTLGQVKLGIDVAKNYYFVRQQVSQLSKNIKTAITAVSKVIELFRPILKTLGTVGTVIDTMEKTLLSASEKVFKLLASDNGVAKQRYETLKKTSKTIGNHKKMVKAASGAADSTAGFLKDLVTFSMEEQCCLEEQMDAVNSAANPTLVFQATAIYEACSAVNIDIDLDLPTLVNWTPPSLDALINIELVVGQMGDWIEETLEGFMEAAAYESCCNPAIAFILDFVNDISGLVMCPVTGGLNGIVSESLDVLLPVIEDPLVTKYNEVGQNLNDLNRMVIDAFKFLDQFGLPAFGVSGSFPDQFLCSMSVGPFPTPFLELQPIGFPEIVSFEPVTFQADGSFDLAGIVGAVVEECSDAVDAFKESPDCCGAATIDKFGSIRQYDQHCDYQGNCDSGLRCVFINVEYGKRCTDGANGSWCDGNGACDSGICYAAGSRGSWCTTGTHNAECSFQSQCKSGYYCNRGRCYDGRKGDRCSIHRDCQNRCPAGTKTCD
jgi:hypothetical protein